MQRLGILVLAIALALLVGSALGQTRSALAEVQLQPPATPLSEFETNFYANLIAERFADQQCKATEGFDWWGMDDEADTRALIELVTSQLVDAGWEQSTTELFPENPDTMTVYLFQRASAALAAVFPAQEEFGTALIFCELE